MLTTGGTRFRWFLSDLHLLMKVSDHFHACAVLPLGKGIPTTRLSFRLCVILNNLLLSWGQRLWVFCRTLKLKSNPLSAVHDCVEYGCLTSFGKVLSGSWTTRVDITISSRTNLLNYCVIFVVFTNVTPSHIKQHDRIHAARNPLVGTQGLIYRMSPTASQWTYVLC